LDIAVGVNELGEADSFIDPLGAIGYEYVPKKEFPNRRFFRKGEWRTYHLHVYETNSDEWNNNKTIFQNCKNNAIIGVEKRSEVLENHSLLFFSASE
jgi:GrpB-like predicted nucleotidyltransferase (UPF0157 family)